MHGAEAVAAGVHGAGERDARRGLQQPGVVAADHPQPEHGAAQRPGGVWARHGVTRVSAMPDHPAPGLVLSPTASVGRDVSFGANVVVHDGVVIGDGVVIQDNVVLGKPPRLAPTSGAPRTRARRRSSSRRARRSAPGRSCSPARTSAPGAIVGDQSYVRERSRVGPNSVIGRGSAIDNDVVIGARVRVQTNVYVTGFSVVEDDVFLGPGVMTTNDDAMGRHAPDDQLRGRPCGARAGSAAPPCSCPASRSARRRSSPPAPWSPTTCPHARSSWASPRASSATSATRTCWKPGGEAPAPTRRARVGAGAAPAPARRAAHRAIAVAALLTGGAVAGTEVARVWRRGSAPLPIEAVGEADSEAAARLAAAGAEALGQTVEVAVRGYQEGTRARTRC